LESERLYALLFGDSSGDDYREREAEAAGELAALADKWSRRSPDECMAVLATVTAEAFDVRDTGVDRRVVLAYELSHRVDILPWLKAAIHHKLDYAVISPLLKKAIFNKKRGWEPLAQSCVGTVAEAAAVEGVLLAGGPTELRSGVLVLLPKYIGFVRQVCIRNEVSAEALPALLSHEDDGVASEAAIYLWHGTKGTIENKLRPLWREAVLRSSGEISMIAAIFSADGDLALDWLRRRTAANDRHTAMPSHVARKVIEPLTQDQRVELLLTLADPESLRDIVGPLFGDSVEVFKRVLAAGGHESLCRMVIGRQTDEIWAAFVTEGYSHGMSVDVLAQASMWLSGWWGPESADLLRRIEQLAPFLEDQREAVRTVARRMTDLLTARRQRMLAAEHEERVWGS
jgi:hypothetical protein